MHLLKNERGSVIFEAILVALVLVAIGSAFYFANKARTSKNDYSVVVPKSNKAATTAPTPTPDPYAGWKQYCSKQEKSCFKYPTTWTAKDVSAVDPSGDGLQLTSPAGTKVWFESVVSGLGGACDATKDPHVFINKVIAEPNAANVYIVESGDRNNTLHIGLVNGTNGQAPKLGDIGDCIYYTTFKSKQNPSNDTWFESNGTADFDTSDLATAELMLKSYTY